MPEFLEERGVFNVYVAQELFPEVAEDNLQHLCG